MVLVSKYRYKLWLYCDLFVIFCSFCFENLWESTATAVSMGAYTIQDILLKISNKNFA